MRIFLSYAGVHRSIADAIVLRLRQAGHSVFFDLDALPLAESYDERIRRAIDASDALVFLVSPESVTPGAYALTELEFARRRWEDPSGKVLPVMIADTDYAHIPAYLRAVTVLEPHKATWRPRQRLRSLGWWVRDAAGRRSLCLWLAS